MSPSLLSMARGLTPMGAEVLLDVPVYISLCPHDADRKPVSPALRNVSPSTGPSSLTLQTFDNREVMKKGV
ncbi:hypothetical protein CesoFtcFv8_026728 [Champsocephalus esox]|uniref:Uncharacterized protein n=1 Tax=Champsocephalus esox TaxID=159716 RepID=A0AAN8AZN7_9TELE|nr:hypothetical protein CesoFtcFv8_026728 [Champsocephalus esox]